MSNNFSQEDTTEDALPGFFVDAEGKLHRGERITVTDENNQEVQMGLDWGDMRLYPLYEGDQPAQKR